MLALACPATPFFLFGTESDGSSKNEKFFRHLFTFVSFQTFVTYTEDILENVGDMIGQNRKDFSISE